MELYNLNNKLFYKIFHSQYLKNKIFSYIKYYNQIYYSCKFYYINYNKFIESINQCKYQSIVIGNLNSYEQLKDFFDKLPDCVTILEFKKCNIEIEIKDFSFRLPNQITHLKFNDEFIIKDSINNSLFNFNNNNNDKNNSKNNFKNNESITSLSLSIGTNLIFENQIYPKNLKFLTISHKLKKPIRKNQLPKNLIQFNILSKYKFNSIQLPKQLKKLSLEFYTTMKPKLLESLPINLKELVIFSGLEHRENRTLNKELSKSLIKIRIVEDNINYLDSNLINLKSLDISMNYSYSTINIDQLPSSITNLKLPANAKLVNSKGNNCEINSNVVNFECSFLQLFNCKFKESTKIKKITLDSQKHQKIINIVDESNNPLNQFTNLKSLKYFDIESFHSIYLPTNGSILKNITNFEIISSLNLVIDLNYSVSFKKLISLLTNLKSLKLDYKMTSLLLYNNGDCKENYGLISFPNSLTLLDLEFTNTKNNNQKSSIIIPESLVISNKTLPPLVEILIIRGITPPTFNIPLPISLNHLYISNRSLFYSQSTIQDNSIYEKFSNIIRPFSSEDDKLFSFKSKIYKKYKKNL